MNLNHARLPISPYRHIYYFILKNFYWIVWRSNRFAFALSENLPQGQLFFGRVPHRHIFIIHYNKNSACAIKDCLFLWFPPVKSACGAFAPAIAKISSLPALYFGRNGGYLRTTLYPPDLIGLSSRASHSLSAMRMRNIINIF